MPNLVSSQLLQVQNRHLAFRGTINQLWDRGVVLRQVPVTLHLATLVFLRLPVTLGPTNLRRHLLIVLSRQLVRFLQEDQKVRFHALMGEQPPPKVPITGQNAISIAMEMEFLNSATYTPIQLQ